MTLYIKYVMIPSRVRLKKEMYMERIGAIVTWIVILTMVSVLVSIFTAYVVSLPVKESLRLTFCVTLIHVSGMLFFFSKMIRQGKKLIREQVNFEVSPTMLGSLLNAQLKIGVIVPWITTFFFSAIREDIWSMSICIVATISILPHIVTMLRLYRSI